MKRIVHSVSVHLDHHDRHMIGISESPGPFDSTDNYDRNTIRRYDLKPLCSNGANNYTAPTHNCNAKIVGVPHFSSQILFHWY